MSLNVSICYCLLLTVLFRSVFFFRFNLVKLVILLLENGASVTMRNKRELTPLQYAHVILDHIF